MTRIFCRFRGGKMSLMFWFWLTADLRYNCVEEHQSAFKKDWNLQEDGTVSILADEEPLQQKYRGHALTAL
jgi:hypothetical protein